MPELLECVGLPVSVPVGFEAGHVPRILEWACLTEGRHRSALSRSNTRNGRVRFLPLPVSSIPSFPAGQESLSLAVLHFVAALRVRADRLRSLDCHRDPMSKVGDMF